MPGDCKIAGAAAPALQGARYVKLTVYDRDPAALAFYHSIGFESCEDELPLVLRSGAVAVD